MTTVAPVARGDTVLFVPDVVSDPDIDIVAVVRDEPEVDGSDVFVGVQYVDGGGDNVLVSRVPFEINAENSGYVFRLMPGDTGR